MEVMIGLGAACLLIRLGLLLYRCGQIRAKNAAGSVLRVVGDFCVATLAFWAVGAALMMQTRHSFRGIDSSLIAFRSGGSADLFFLITLILTGTGIAGGAVAERSRFFPLWAVSILLAAIVIPIGGQWAWFGWLAHLGFIDIGGAAWLHLSGAVCACVAAFVVGPRTGKYHTDGSSSMIPGHNIPYVGVGAMAMLVGWVPYLAGCLILLHYDMASIGSAAISTLIAGAAGGLAAILLAHYRYGKPDVIITLLGFLGGLVAISAGAGRLATPWAVVIGGIAGLIVPMSAIFLDIICRIDDPIGVIAIHGIGGLWGTIAAGLFATGDVTHRLRQLGVQILGIVAIAILSFAFSAALFAVLKLTVRLRVSEAEEFEGLDLAQLDIGAYPDFQQNTIKSYHLREA